MPICWSLNRIRVKERDDARMQTILVSDNTNNWRFLSELTTIVEATEYLLSDTYHQGSLRVINLCENYAHQSIGYYVSLLAHARGHKAIPSIDNIQDSLHTDFIQFIPTEIDNELQDSLKNIKGDTFILSVYFGQNMAASHQRLAKCLHGFLPLPLIQAYFERKKRWQFKSLKALSLKDIPTRHMEFMQQAAEAYLSKKRFHPWRQKKRYYNLAILVDPKEENAPSNPKALDLFANMGESMGLNVDFVEKDDHKMLGEYDALFIRATTAVNHYTYRWARRASQENMIVIDDPQSIVKCTNKVYLAELLRNHQILTPDTLFISKYDKELPSITFPCVLKKPDSSFSHGVIKVDDMPSLKKSLTQFFKSSDLVIAQSFIPTDFDWRIGVLDNKVLYACRYFMAKGHWQIFNWSAHESRQEGPNETVPLGEVPEGVIKTALKGARLIGDGLYGVDLKAYGDQHYIIEINDNPNIDYGIEDKLEGELLYQRLIGLFLERIQRSQEKK